MSAASRPANGADRIARCLVDLGVETVFCYPGGANLEILDALSRVAIDLVRTEHEQGAVFAAQGYARASGRLGVCLATSGPGATNLVTGIADANSDSIPILALTGNVATRWLGRNAFQEVDIVAVTRPITKQAVQVRSIDEIVPTLAEAVMIATSGRCGPVLVDFPKDIQQTPCPEIAAPVSQKHRAAAPGSVITAAQLQQIATLLATARRPVIYAGGGVTASGTGDLLTRLAETLECPVALTLMGLGAVAADHPLCLGPLGMHGAWTANVAVNEADVVLALGVRFDDRVIGDPDAFARPATIIHIDVDADELGKNKVVALGLSADLRDALPALLSIAGKLDSGAWRDYLALAAAEHPLIPPAVGDDRLTGPRVIARLDAALPPGAIVTTGVGQHQMWAMQHLKPRAARHFLSSAGFGTMGFGLPAAIGAKKAKPGALVIDVDGDGSLNMTINELSTCRRYRLGVKVLVVNNQWLGMVRQWQDMIYGANRVVSGLGDPLSEVRPQDVSGPYPDFLAIAAGYRVAASRVTKPEELDASLARLLADPDEPYLLDVIVAQESDVVPMIPSGKSYRDVIFDTGRAGLRDT
jgi:acetolactate synthase-1/2/3 large subunit